MIYCQNAACGHDILEHVDEEGWCMTEDCPCMEFEPE